MARILRSLCSSALSTLLPSAALATTTILIEDGNCLPRSLRDKASGKNPIKLTECEDLRLTAAGGLGVSGSQKHEYVLKGTCIRYDACRGSSFF